MAFAIFKSYVVSNHFKESLADWFPMQIDSPTVCIYSYAIFILGTDHFYLDVIDRHRRYNNEYIYGFKFVIMNNHLMHRIIHDAVIVFIVKIALHFLL